MIARETIIVTLFIGIYMISGWLPLILLGNRDLIVDRYSFNEGHQEYEIFVDMGKTILHQRYRDDCPFIVDSLIYQIPQGGTLGLRSYELNERGTSKARRRAKRGGRLFLSRTANPSLSNEFPSHYSFLLFAMLSLFDLLGYLIIELE
jgi:hypothetical protein